MPDTEECTADEGRYCDCAACDAALAEQEALYRASWDAERALIDARDAYDISDPKHPDWADTMAARADALRKGGF